MKILAQLPTEVKKGQMVALDFETFDQVKGKLHRPNGTFAMISVAIEGDPNIYQLYDHNDLRKLVQVANKGTWVFHNALYDLRQFRRYVPSLKPRFIWDTMLADQSMWGGYYATFGLDDLSRRWLGKAMEKDVREDFYTKRDITPQMKNYAAKDATTTLEIALLQRTKYEDDPAWKAYTVADEPMFWPILDMPGFRVDVKNWEVMIQEFQEKARQLEDELEINVYSKNQVLAALAKREKLHLENTQNKTLVEYIDRPMVRDIIEARMYRKAVSSYGMKWLSNVEEDGKVYSDYKITGAKTGRMSSSNPAMQNIPQRKLPQYRSHFLPSPGNVMEIWDVSQQEPSITAFHSRDRKLIDALNRGESTHLTVAREIYDNPTMTKDSHPMEYRHGKDINLGLTYGLTAHGLAERTKLTLPEAEAMIRKYFMKFSGVKGYIDTQRDLAYRRGYVSTALGRRFYINPYDKSWENNAINSPIQGGAVDFTKVWARKIWEKSVREGIPYTTVAFIHDEVVKDTPKDVVKISGKLTQEAFDETAEQLYKGIPFAVEKEIGKSWGAKAIKSELIDLDEEGEEE